jgi:hypothetical protein
MKEITISCQELTTIFENYASNFKKKLMLLLFVAFATTSAFAQNSCAVSGVGPAVGGVFPIPVISTCYDNAGLTYQSNPLDLSSTFQWSISEALGFENTSGAFIIGATNGNTVSVNSGPNNGSFFLVCIATGTSGSQACGLSVAVFKPTVTADPKTVCSGSTVTLTGSPAEGVWSGNHVTGNIFDATGLAAGPYTVTYTYTDIHGCSNFAEATVTVSSPATANANIDQNICAGSTVTLAGSVGGGASSGTWSTSGTGSFDSSASTLNAVYTPSAADVTAGTVTLTLTTNDPEGACPAVQDGMIVTINPPATANANVDQTICAGSTVTLAGSVGGGASSGTWSTSGTGSFDPSAITLNAVYTPSAADVTAGTVTLTLTTNDPEGACPAVSDAMVVIIESCAQQGCTLGYWKNHTDRWCGAYRTCDRFGDVFANTPSNLANLTLLQALNLGGGGIYNLARQGVAALLNACSSDVDYAGYSDNPQSVINAVSDAYKAGGNAPGLLAFQLDKFNNAGCPLGGTRATNATNCIVSAPTTNTSTKTEAIKTELAGFTASPVPFKNQLTIRYDFDYQSDVTIEVFNAQGGLVFSKLDTNSYLNKEVTFNIKVNKDQDQLYIVKLTTNQGSSTRKVMSSR